MASIQNSDVRKYPESLPILIILGALLAAILLITGGNYGIFRDELYYIDCANHPSVGYVDQPPVSILVLTVWKAVFGDSLLSLRIIPALLGALIVIITGFITFELGGNRFAQVLSAVTVMAAPYYLAVAGFYSMNIFDLFFWALLFYLLVRIIRTENSRLWIPFGITAGLALMNKISILFFGAGLAVSMVLTAERKYFTDRYFWAAGYIALALFAPYIIWNLMNDMATLEFIRNAARYKIADIPPGSFLSAQVLEMNPILFPFWFAGLLYLIFSKNGRRFRLLGFIYLVCLVIFLIQKSKPYYLAASYTALLAAGSCFIGGVIASKGLNWLKPVVLLLVIASGVFVSPFAIPVLSPDKLVDYTNSLGMRQENAEVSRLGKLPQIFADRFGWEEMAEKVAKVYNSLSPDEKKMAGIFARNYGEAGAVNYYGRIHGLPRVMSGHNNHWLWGPEGDSLDILIVIGGRREDALESFETVEQVDTAVNRYAMPYESDLPIYLCRGIKRPIRDIWAGVKMYI